MTFAIGSSTFATWEGPPPNLVQIASRPFTRPGVNGVAEQLLGTVGAPFSVQLTGHFSTYALALAGFNTWRALSGTGPLVVTYSGVNYWTTYTHKYSVLRVDPVDSFTGLLVGPTWSYASGGGFVANFQLQPHA